MHMTTHYPSAEQVLLLRASILHGDIAIRACNDWLTAVHFEELDYGSIQLLPLLYKNLKLLDTDHPSVNILRGVYRRVWYQNQMLFSEMVPVLKALYELKLDCMLLEGAALTLTQYRDTGLRPIHDFVVMVPPEHGDRTVSSIVKIGLSSKLVSSGMRGAIFRAEKAEDGPKKEGVPTFELRNSLFPESEKANIDNIFWKDADLTQLWGVPIRTLNTTDQLLLACVQTTRWHHLMPLSGFGDAMFILENSSAELDWNRFHFMARSLGFINILDDIFGYLETELKAPVPIRF